MAKPIKPPPPVTIKGTLGDDTLTIPAGTSITNVKIDGSGGNDTLNLSNYANGVTIQLQDGFAKASSLVTDKPFTGLFPNFSMTDSGTVRGSITNVENLIGTSHNDFLFVYTTSPKYVDGGAGNDVIESLRGNATLVGGTGNDWLVAYWPNVTLIGGTYANGVANPDNSTDYFYIGSGAPTILDFETSFDKLILEFASGTIEATNWVSNGAGGSTLMVGGTAKLTLANVALADAQGIELGYALLPVNGRVEGSSGDDLLWTGGNSTARVVLGSNTGDDVAVDFNIANDILVFEDGVTPVWSDTLVNGAAALLGTWTGGSITIQGLDTGDVPNLLMEGLTTGLPYGPAGPGPWSSASDYLLP